eukprot:scaffold372037_cov35-Attheya_sp.AAC.1
MYADDIIPHPLPRRLGTYGETQSTEQVQRGYFQSKNHDKPSWGSKTTLIIVKNGTINNVKITFSLTLHVFTTLFRVDWGLME